MGVLDGIRYYCKLVRPQLKSEEVSMAQALNKKRILVGRLTLVLVFLLALFTRGHFPDGGLVHDINDNLGVLLLCVCILGRVYCTLQIGGRKNAQLVTSGIYSVVRNPLYMFSFVGVLGIGLISNQVTVLALLVAAFFLVYLPLIQREEAYLQSTFGEAFTSYVARVPRLVPAFGLYQPPGTVTVNLSTLHAALRDAVWWILPFAIFETIEWAQGRGIVRPLFALW